MSRVEGPEAFALLWSLAANEPHRPFVCAEPAFERLRGALLQEASTRSPLDLAVLVRHALMFENARRANRDRTASLRISKGLAPVSAEDWRRVGIVAEESVTHWSVRVVGWSPDWLPGSSTHPVDSVATQEEERRPFYPMELCGVDPFLASVSKQIYRSPGQRVAIRGVLSMPPGATVAVNLPTGEGKSLAFQLIDRVGFGRDSHQKSVTVVAVPTVTLALDHERSMRGETDIPRAYISGDEVRNKQIRERVALGTQGLVFASPEALCGPLRAEIEQASAFGFLRALVVDEAHLVEGWGTAFRTEFQLLSAVRAGWQEKAPDDAKFRTVLLSATYTEQALATLRSLFCDPGQSFAMVGSLRVRPEIEYWVAVASNREVQRRYVVEAMCHLPRPAILYVTTPDDAEDWRQHLRSEGFANNVAVHGKTDSASRDQILALWHAGELDLVVATSAFGLGVDYPHVRAVVHACVPETLDRFYQEVGRSGRDGKAAVSVLVPTAKDFNLARSLNSKAVLTIARGLTRWKAMFGQRKEVGLGRFLVPLDVAPGHSIRDIDMQGEKNTDWNARALVLMARSGLLRLRNYADADNKGPSIEVEILNDGHMDLDVWEAAVAPVRENIAAANWHNLQRMETLIKRRACPSRLVAELYGLEMEGEKIPVARSCGGCTQCREDPSRKLADERAIPVSAPWGANSHLSGEALSLLSDGRLIVYYKTTDIGRPAWERRLSLLLDSLFQDGIRKLCFLGPPMLPASRLAELADQNLFFCEAVDSLVKSRLPMGAEVVLVAPKMKLTNGNLEARPAGQERIFLVPDNQEAPDRRSVALRNCYTGRDLNFDEFLQRIAG